MRAARSIAFVALLLVQVSCASAQSATGRIGKGVPGQAPNTDRSTVSIKTPSYSVFANALNDPAIVTWAAYGANSAAWTSATQFVTAAGGSHQPAEFNWDELEPTQGNYTWTLIDRFVRDSGTLPLIIKISPIGSDGTRHTPSDLNGLAYSSTTLSNAYNTMLDTLAPRLNHRLWVLAIGNEMDTYFATHASLISAYATFLSRTAPHARTVFGTQPFKVTACFTSAVLTSWSTYAAISAQLDLNYFSYFVGGSSNLPVDFGNMGTHGPFVLDFGAPSNTPVLGSSETLQALLVQAMIGYAAGTGKLVAASYFQLAEISTAVLASFGSTTPALELVQSLGLIDLSGNPKPGWQIMLEVLQGQVTPPPPTIVVNRPSWSIVANPANDPAIVTATAYLANTTGKIAAQAKAITAGADHLQEVLKWSDVEPTTVGVYDFSKVDTFVNNSGTLPLILNLAPIWDDGTKSVPTALSATAWDATTMSNAYINMLTALASHLKGRLWILGVGNEIDVYLSAHPTEIPQFATFLSRLRTPARTLYGTNPFSITTTFRSTAVDSWATYTSILLFTDLESFTYYPVADSNLSTTVVSDITHLLGIVGNGPVMFQEVGLSSAGSSSETIQAQGVALIVAALSNYAKQGNNIVAVTWSSLEDLSAAVIASFGYSSGQFTTGLGVRDTSDAPKQAFALLCDYLGGTACQAAPPPACTFSLAKTSDLFTSAAGSGSVVLTTQTGCAWTLSVIGGTPAWLTIGPASGTGTTTIHYSVVVNPDTIGRSATAVIGYAGGSQTFSVSQDGAQPPPPPPTCTFSVSKTSDTFTTSSGSHTLTLTAADSTCAWTAAVLDGVTWLSVSPTSGAGNATITYSVTANTGDAARTGRFTIGDGDIVTIVQDGIATPPPPPDPNYLPCNSTTNSPTGVNPKANWTPCRQDTWNQMYADYLTNPATPPTMGGKWFKLIKGNADCNCRYGDIGQWDVYMYQMTGNAAYAASAYSKIMAFFPLMDGVNFSDKLNIPRETAIGWVRWLNWLEPALSAAQVEAFKAEIAQWVGFSFGQEFPGAPGVGSSTAAAGAGVIGTGDSDQDTGMYFAAAMFHLLYPADSRATAIWNTSVVGGLTPTMTAAAYHGDLPIAQGGSLRNSVQNFVYMAAGGTWIEGTEYDFQTTDLLLEGWDALRTITGTEYFPEVPPYLQQHADQLVAVVTPDLKQAYQQGDVGEPGMHFPGSMPNMTARVINMMSYAGILQGTTNGRRVQGLLADLFALRGYLNIQPGSNPRTGCFIFYNPYDTATDWRTNKFHFSNGTGFVTSRTGFGTSDSQYFFWGNTKRSSTDGIAKAVDHYGLQLGNHELYKNGEWAIVNLKSYGGPAWFSDGNNGPLMHGYGGTIEFSELTYAKQTDAFTMVSATTGGTQLSHQPSENPVTPLPLPRVMVNEWTRGEFFLPGTTDVIVVHDRANVINPIPDADLGYYGGYDGVSCIGCLENINTMRMFDSYHASKLIVQRALTQPTLIGNNTFGWSTVHGQPVQMKTLFPASIGASIIDERTLTYEGWDGLLANDQGAIATTGGQGQVRWQIKEYPPVTQTFDTFLNVLQVGPPYTVNAISDPGKVEGAQIVRTGLPDTVVLFNAQSGGSIDTAQWASSHVPTLRAIRYRGQPFTVSWTAVGASTGLYLEDLNPGVNWTLNVDGGGASTIVPDGGGHYTTTIGGAGLHTVAAIGDGSAPPPDITSCTTIAIAPTSLPNGLGNSAYAQTISASGGTGPYSYTVSSGTLPTGLSLNASTGALTGTPTVPDTYTFTVRATGADTCFADRTYTLIVDAPPVIGLGRNTTTTGQYGQVLTNVSGSSNAITGTVTVGNAGTNRLALVEVTGGATDTLVGCTLGGSAMTLITKVQNPADLYFYALHLVNPSVGAQTLTCTFSSNTAMALLFHGYVGVNQTTPINTSTTLSSANASVIDAQLNVTNTGTWTVMAHRAWAGSAAGLGSSRVYDAPGVGLAVYDAGPQATVGTKSMQATFTGATRFGAVMFAINPAP